MRYLAAAAVLAATPLVAQTSSFTLPPGHDVIPGDKICQSFGGYAKARFQYAEGTMPKKKAQFLSVAYRTQRIIGYSPVVGTGRSWAKFSLTMGHCADASKITTNFATNYKGTSTLVYSSTKFSFPDYSKVNWPKQVWGNVATILLTKPWSYNGADDVILDYSFDGGKLVNGTWRGLADYHMDGFQDQTQYNSFGEYLPGHPWTFRCKDPKARTTNGAHTKIHLRIFANGQGQIVNGGQTEGTQPNAPIITALTVGGFPKGLPFPAVCNPKLYVDTRFIVFQTQLKTSGTGATNGFLSTKQWKYNEAWAGAELYFQGAWNDSKSLGIALTIANRIVLPKIPKLSKQSTAFEWYSGSQRRGPWKGSLTNYNPTERITFK